MSDTPQDALIARLAATLQPVRRLPPPWRRTAAWLAAALWIALLLSLFTDWAPLRTRLMATPDMWLSLFGAALTAILAGAAALQTAIPGRSPFWAALPIPALSLWIAASAAGCLRLSPIPGTVPEAPMHPAICLEFLLLVSLPLAILLTWQLKRAYPVRPTLTAALAGLAAAAAAAALLALIHPFDTTWPDLASHAAGVVVVVVGARIAGGRALRQG